MHEQNSRSARLRYTATGALAALAAVGAIAGTAALAAKPSSKARGHAAVATKTATSPMPDKTQTPPPPVNHQPFFNAIQQLVDNGTITATEAQAVDREIQAGRVDTDTLAGFTQPQLQAVQQALSNAKRALASSFPGASGTPKEPPPAGTGAPSGGKEPPPAAPGNGSTTK